MMFSGVSSLGETSSVDCRLSRRERTLLSQSEGRYWKFGESLTKWQAIVLQGEVSR